MLVLAALAMAATTYAQVTHPDAQLRVRGTVKAGDKFGEGTKAYSIGGLYVTVKVDSDLDRFMASKLGREAVVTIEVAK